MRVVLMASACGRTRRVAIAELLAVPGRTVLRYGRIGAGWGRDAHGRGVGAAAEACRLLAPGACADAGDRARFVAEDLPVALAQVDNPALDQVVVALPQGLDVGLAVRTLEAAERLDEVLAIAVAVDPGALYGTVRSSMPAGRARLVLAEECANVDDAAAGALVGNLLWADTVVLVDGIRPIGGMGPAVGLLTHLAPCARIMHLACRRFAWSGFDPAEAAARTRPGAVSAPVRLESVDGVRTALFASLRPLHAGRLVERVPALSERCVFSRGRAWLAADPERRTTWWGTGSTVSLGDGGPWLSPRERPAADVPSQRALDWRPGRGDRGTSLAFTGQDLDADRIARLLDECVLDDAELAAFARARQPVEGGAR